MFENLVSYKLDSNFAIFSSELKGSQMNTHHDLFYVMNIYLIMYFVYIIINVICMYHKKEDPTWEPLGNNQYTIGKHGCIHANNLERPTNLDRSLDCIRMI